MKFCFYFILSNIPQWVFSFSIYFITSLLISGSVHCSGVGENPDLVSGAAAGATESAPLSLEQLKELHEGKLEQFLKAQDACEVKERQLHGLASYRYGVLIDSFKCREDIARYKQCVSDMDFCDARNPRLLAETVEARKLVSTLKKECSDLAGQIQVHQSLLELEESVVRRHGLGNTSRESLLPYSPNKTLSKKR